jgi:hypothetical protein
MKTVARTVVIVLWALAAAGCLVPPKYYPLPPLDQSHAIMIEKAIAGLQIVSMVKDYVRRTEKVAVVSMEDLTSRGDQRFQLVVDDNLIQSLTTAGYRVLERDENMITRIIPEQGTTYKRKLLRQLPTHPSITLMDGLEREGIGYVDPLQLREETARVAKENAGSDVTINVDRLNLAEVTGFYKQLKDDYQALEGQLLHMDTADVMVSYRILEFGILPDVFSRKIGKIDPETGRERFFSCKSWITDIKRDAVARLFVRVMDAKTGEVRMARVIENSLSDTITLKQDKDEREGHYLKRLADYLALLDRYTYKWNDQQLPVQQGAAAQAGRVQAAVSQRKNIFGQVVGPDVPQAAPARRTDVAYPNLVALNILGGATFGWDESTVVMPGIMYSRSIWGTTGLMGGINAYLGYNTGAVFSVGVTKDFSDLIRGAFRFGGGFGLNGIFFSFPTTFRFGWFGLTLDIGGVYSFDDEAGGPVGGIGLGISF